MHQTTVQTKITLYYSGSHSYRSLKRFQRYWHSIICKSLLAIKTGTKKLQNTVSFDGRPRSSWSGGGRIINLKPEDGLKATWDSRKRTRENGGRRRSLNAKTLKNTKFIPAIKKLGNFHVIRCVARESTEAITLIEIQALKVDQAKVGGLIWGILLFTFFN